MWNTIERQGQDDEATGHITQVVDGLTSTCQQSVTL